MFYTPGRDASYSSGAIGLGIFICSHVWISLVQLAYECNLTKSPDRMRTALIIRRERSWLDCKTERDSWHNRGD